MRIGRFAVAVGFALIGSFAGAQEAARIEPIRLEVVLSRHQGEKLVSRFPYTLTVTPELRTPTSPPAAPTRVRMGVQVPIRGGGEPDKVQYRDVGTNLDCKVGGIVGDRYLVDCTFEQSSVFSPSDTSGAAIPATGVSSVPLFRSFRADARLLLKDGETALHTAAADPVSGELLKAEVTLRLLK
jgi:hypothetical protein